MKRLLICGFLFFLCACTSKAKTIQIEVASSIENQIQARENLRVDQIMLNVTYLDNSKQYVVLDETMIKDFDTNRIGLQSLTIEYLNAFLTIPFVIYDDAFLEHNYIYYYELDQDYKIECVSTIQEVSIPQVDNLYFCGWYKDRIRKTACIDDANDRILEIYPLLVAKEQYDNIVLINFMVDGRIDRSCYISKGGLIPYYSPDWEGFGCWDKNEKKAYETMNIYAIHKEKNQIVVRFYQQDGRFDHYEIHEKGVCIDSFKEEDISERLRFAGWNSSLKYLTEDTDLSPAYDTYYHVVFRSTLSLVGILAEQWVIEGGTAYLNAEALGIKVLNYSKRLDDIRSDMTIDVETTNKICLLIYYQGMLISTTYDFVIPEMGGGIGYLEHIDDIRYELKYISYPRIKVYTLDNKKTYDLSDVDYCFTNLNFALMRKNNKSVIYEFFYDKECTNPIPQNYLNFDCYAVTYDSEGIPSFLVPDNKKIYAKPKEVTQKDVLSDYEIKDGHILVMSPNDHFVFGGELDGYWIDTVEFDCLRNCLFIGKDIKKIIIPTGCYIQLAYIDEDNPYLYILNEDIYDKETNEMIIRHS